jgi:hypothetical protein
VSETKSIYKCSVVVVKPSTKTTKNKLVEDPRACYCGSGIHYSQCNSLDSTYCG